MNSKLILKQEHIKYEKNKMAPPKKPLHPIDKVILKALVRTRLQVTPTQISKAVGIHPVTAQKHIKYLKSRGVLKSKKTGNRTYVRPLTQAQLRKFLLGRR